MKLSRRHRKSFHSSTSTNKSSPIKILQFSFAKIKMEPFLPYFSTRDTEAQRDARAGGEYEVTHIEPHLSAQFSNGALAKVGLPPLT